MLQLRLRLNDHAQYRLISGDGIVPEERLEDYLVRGLVDFDDVNYDEHADLLYKLAGEMVKHQSQWPWRPHESKFSAREPYPHSLPGCKLA